MCEKCESGSEKRWEGDVTLDFPMRPVTIWARLIWQEEPTKSRGLK